MGFLTMTGTGFGAYIMAMAALSPCPLLVQSVSGTTVIVRLFFSMIWDCDLQKQSGSHILMYKKYFSK